MLQLRQRPSSPGLPVVRPVQPRRNRDTASNRRASMPILGTMARTRWNWATSSPARLVGVSPSASRAALRPILPISALSNANGQPSVTSGDGGFAGRSHSGGRGCRVGRGAGPRHHCCIRPALRRGIDGDCCRTPSGQPTGSRTGTRCQLLYHRRRDVVASSTIPLPDPTRTQVEQCRAARRSTVASGSERSYGLSPKPVTDTSREGSLFLGPWRRYPPIAGGTYKPVHAASRRPIDASLCRHRTTRASTRGGSVAITSTPRVPSQASGHAMATSFRRSSCGRRGVVAERACIRQRGGIRRSHCGLTHPTWQRISEPRGSDSGSTLG